MPHDITGYFDGKVIVPDQPLKLELGQKLRVRIEAVTPDEIYPLAEILAMATDMGTESLAADHKQLASPGPGNAN